ncbi:restless-like transposase [Apiospora arundinis]
MSQPTTNSILVIGAGELGTAVLEALAKHPELSSGGGNTTTLSVMIRASSLDGATTDPAKKRHNAYLRDNLGVSGFVPGDIGHDTVETLAAAFRPFDTIICCAGFGDAFHAGTQLKISRAVIQAATTAAKDSGRKKRYFPWQWGMDYDAIGTGSAQDLFDEQLQVRALLRGEDDDTSAEAKVAVKTAVDWVIVSTALFMSFLFRADFGVVDLPARTVRCLGDWATEISVTTPRDIGVMAAEIALRPRGIANQVVYVAGDTVSYARVAELVQERLSSSSSGATEIRKEAWDREFLRRELAKKPGDVMLKYRGCFAEGRGVAFDMDKTVNKQRGIVLQDVRSYLKEMEI